MDTALECCLIHKNDQHHNSRTILTSNPEDPFKNMKPNKVIPYIDRKLCRVIMNMVEPEAGDWVCPVLERIIWELPREIWIDLNFLNLHFIEEFAVKIKCDSSSRKTSGNALLDNIRKAAVLFIYLRGSADLGLDEDNRVISIKLRADLAREKTAFLDLDHNQQKNHLIRIPSSESCSLIRTVAAAAVLSTGPDMEKHAHLFMQFDKQRCKKSFNLGITGPELIKRLNRTLGSDIPENIRQKIIEWWNDHGEAHILTADIIITDTPETMARARKSKNVKKCFFRELSPKCSIITKNKRHQLLKELNNDDFMIKSMNVSENSNTIDREDMRALLWALNAVSEASGDYENIFSKKISDLKKRFAKALSTKENKRIRLESREALFYMKKNLKLLEDDKIAAFNEQDMSPEKAGFAKVNPLLKEALAHEIPMQITYHDPSENQRITRDIHGPYRIVKQGKFYYLKAYTDIFKDSFTIRLNNIISIILE
jgi:hypothetical protein